MGLGRVFVAHRSVRHERGSWRGVEGAGAAPAKGGAYAAAGARAGRVGWTIGWNLEMESGDVESRGSQGAARVGTLPCCNYPATCSPWPRLRLAGEGYCVLLGGSGLARGRRGLVRLAPRITPRRRACGGRGPPAGVLPSPLQPPSTRLWGGVVPVAMYFQVATPSDSVVGGAGR